MDGWGGRGRSVVAAAIAAAAVLDNEATDARSYLPIRNENEGERGRDSLRFELVDPVHDPHAPSLSLSLSLLPMID